MQVKCPGCGKPIEWSVGNRWRPFCSERCRLVDLGAWFAGEHVIPGEPQAEQAAEPPDHPDRPH